MKRFFWVLLALILVLPKVAGATDEIVSISQLNNENMTVGVDTGDVAELSVAEDLPLAKIAYFNDVFTGYEAVANGKIDAFAYDKRQMELSIENGQKGVRLLDETLSREMYICVGISGVSKIDNLEEKVNLFIADMRANGTLDDMYDRWVNKGETQMPPIKVDQSSPLHLKIGTSGIVPPYSYYIGSELAGYDIELGYRFAEWLGASVEFEVYDYGSIFAAAESGAIDCVMADLQEDDERRESFTFSDPLFVEQVGLMVRDTSSRSTIFGNLSDSFYKTFVREDRWQMFASGAAVTLLITLFSLVLGTALGFALLVVRQDQRAILDPIIRFCLWLVHGMPLVVLLLILYHVVFRQLPVSGVVVSVVGFTIVFGVAVYDMLQTGVGAVGREQSEAALALGYTSRKALLRHVLPQAIPHVLLPYRQEAIELMKSTAVVGYLAVRDLTKAGDIVRSRTYEAFFPLIAVTVIYFVLEAVLNFGLARIEARFDPRRRTAAQILQGVNTHAED